MELQEIIDRNYAATVRRGQINDNTSNLEFIEKLEEEVKELKYSLMFDGSFDKLELADVELVCTAMAKHNNIDSLKVMEEKMLFNEKRKD